jgi:SSS family solute:Na+ symporter
MLAGMATSVMLYALNQKAVYEALGLRPLFQIQEPFLYFSIWAFLVTLSLTVILSLLTKREPIEKMAFVVGRLGKSESENGDAR